MLATDEQRQKLVDFFHTGTKQTYSKGEYIVRPGDSPRGVLYIESGFVKAHDITKYGEENLLIVRKSHEIFPLIWALTGQERQVIYQALAPTTAWVLSRECFEEEIVKHPNAMAPLLDMAIEMYRLHSERILNLEYRSVRERIVSFLLTMATRFGYDVEDGLAIGIPLRHQDIASSVNASRETTSREIAALERRGYIKNRQASITIVDEPSLRAMLS